MFNSLVRARDQYFALPRLQFEAITLGLAVLVGLLIMPVLIYFAGYSILQKYSNLDFGPGLLELYGDFFTGLFHLQSACWVVVAGPYVFLSVFRIFRWVLRKV